MMYTEISTNIQTETETDLERLTMLAETRKTQIDAALAYHQPVRRNASGPGYRLVKVVVCGTCGTHWPCGTAGALGIEDVA